jgi:hypothetical protein
MLGAGVSQHLSTDRLQSLHASPCTAPVSLAPVRPQQCFQSPSTSGRPSFRFAQRYAHAQHSTAAYHERHNRHMVRAVYTEQVVETASTTPTCEYHKFGRSMLLKTGSLLALSLVSPIPPRMALSERSWCVNMLSECFLVTAQCPDA